MYAAKRIVEDSYYQRLCRDLERGTRRRKIAYAKYRWVLEVMKLPRTVPEHRREEITQAVLDRAHEMADLISSELNGPLLAYDSAERVIMLHGSYGSRQ